MTMHPLSSAVVVTVILAACFSEPPPLSMTFSDMCKQEAKIRIAVDGYLRLPLLGISCQSGRCLIAFYAGPGGKGAWIGAEVRNTARPDSGVNAIEMPAKTYRIEDLRVHLKDGRVVGQDARVRLTGKVRKSGNSCRLEVDVIEAP